MKESDSRQRVSAQSLNKRVKLIKLLLLVGFGMMISRLAYIQLAAPSLYVSRVDKVLRHMLGRELVILEAGTRGLILDNKGRPFTTQKRLRRVKVTPNNFDKGPNSRVLAVLAEEFPKMIGIADRYPKNKEGYSSFFDKMNFVVSADCPDNVWTKVHGKIKSMYESGDIKNRPSSMIHEEISFRRHYVEENMLCHLIGSVDRKEFSYRLTQQAKMNLFRQGSRPSIGEPVKMDIGNFGLERKLNDHLSATIGFRRAAFSRFRSFRLDQLEPENGNHLVLTIDKLVQLEVQKQIDEIQDKFNPVASAIIVTHPASGQIIAMGGKPDFDLNALADHGWGLQKDAPEFIRETIAFNAQFEPGSTFKPLILAAALEEGLLKPGEKIYCPPRYPTNSSKPVRESNYGYKGEIPWEGIIYESSNVGAAKVMVEKLGFPKGYQYIQDLGFGKKTSAFLPDELRGNIRKGISSYREVDYSRVAIGQSLNVTGMQLMMAFGTLANDGLLHEATITKGFISHKDPDNFTPYQPLIRRANIWSQETCDLMINAMRGVLENRKGTGLKARLENHTAAGKTGTAEIQSPIVQLPVPDQGHYKYTGSFIGFFPASTPQRQVEREKMIKNRYCVGVWVYAPHRSGGGYYGGTVAAPSFKAICERIAQIYHIPSDLPAPEDVSPSRSSASRIR